MNKLIKTFLIKFRYIICNYFEIDINYLLSTYGVKLTPILNDIRNYEILPVAISNTNSKVKLTNFKNHSGKSTLLNINETENISLDKVQAINSEGLERLFERNVNFIIKIDVEGHEEVVIKELIKVKNFNKVYSIFYEVNIDWSNPTKIEQILREVGFCYFKKIGRDNFHYDILATKIKI